MSNGQACCALQLCCDPDSPQQRKALIEEIVHGTGCDPAEAATMADFINKEWDLAPKGTLQPFKAAIVKMIKKQSMS